MQKFYICTHCKQIVVKVKDKNIPIVCCGEKMVELIPNTVEASAEKHIPVVDIQNNKVEVTVGSVLHPMVEEHYIEWILLSTNKKNQRQVLKPGDSPKATFYIGEDEKVTAVYAYCNLHGLWVYNN